MDRRGQEYETITDVLILKHDLEQPRTSTKALYDMKKPTERWKTFSALKGRSHSNLGVFQEVEEVLLHESERFPALCLVAWSLRMKSVD